MEKTENFYNRYLELVRTADTLLTKPVAIKNEIQNSALDVEHFGACLAENLTALQDYPSLRESLFGLIAKEGMTGYLGEFLINDAISMCAAFKDTETGIKSKAIKIKETTNSDAGTLNLIIAKAESWRRIVSFDNIRYVDTFLKSLEKEVDKHYEALSTQDKLGRALARSEEERRRLLEIEEARRKGITEMELDKEEKRRKARDEYIKNIKTRKKK